MIRVVWQVEEVQGPGDVPGSLPVFASFPDWLNGGEAGAWLEADLFAANMNGERLASGNYARVQRGRCYLINGRLT